MDLHPTNEVVHAAGGAAPSLILLDEAQAGDEVQTRLTATGANGAVGVVLGFEDRGHFLALDWRRAAETNSFGDVANAGLRLVSFHMPDGVERASAVDFFSSPDPVRTTVWKTNALTWVEGKTYDVVLRSDWSSLQVELYDGTTNLVQWSVPELAGPVGWFGYYTYGVAAADFGPATVVQASGPITITRIAPALGGQWTIEWTGGAGLFQLERSDDLSLGTWQPVGEPSEAKSRTIEATGRSAIFRVRAVP